MPKFKMKPRVIEAIQWMGDNHYEAMQFVGDLTTVLLDGTKYPMTTNGPSVITFVDRFLLLDTVDGIRTLGVGDYVVKQEGEFIAIDQEDFEATYMHYE